MSKLFKKLQIALTSYEERPVETVTKQTFTESLYIIRGKDQGSSAWHYILVPIDKVADLKNQQAGETIDITKFGRIIHYKKKLNEIRPSLASGWGTDPPQMFRTWIEEQYDPASVDESINLKYVEDDIRLCTMQRATLEQKLGVQFYYHRQERFLYIKLTEEYELSLARRAGLKKYDRIISFNGTNIQEKTYEEFIIFFDAERHLPAQMLVCSPATYQDYKNNNQSIHNNLPTVQHLKPVFAASTSNAHTDEPAISFDKHKFCAIQWEKNEIITIVSQSAVVKSPEFTHINDTCIVEKDKRYEKGKVIFIGSYRDCKKFRSTFISSVTDNLFNRLNNLFARKIHKFPRKSTKQIQQYELTKLEDLPDELLLSIFTHLDLNQLYNAFWSLNQRLNRLFQSCRNLSLIYNDEINLSSVFEYAPHVKRIIVDTSNRCCFNQFPNLHMLVLGSKNTEHFRMINPEIFFKLTHLTLLLGSDYIPPLQLLNEIFSKKFPSLIHADLGLIDSLQNNSSFHCPSLQFLAIRSKDIRILTLILRACSNLSHLQLHILNSDACEQQSSSTFDHHSLRRLTLWSDSNLLNFEHIENILSYTINIQHLYLQTEYKMSLIELAQGLVHRLRYLYRFHCHIKEFNENSNKKLDILSVIHKLHPCYNRIKCIEEKEDFRIFATD